MYEFIGSSPDLELRGQGILPWGLAAAVRASDAGLSLRTEVRERRALFPSHQTREGGGGIELLVPTVDAGRAGGVGEPTQTRTGNDCFGERAEKSSWGSERPQEASQLEVVDT